MTPTYTSLPGLPKIIANDNANNGIQIEFGSKLDIGRNSSIEVTNNGKAGISLDNGSSAILHDSVITGNNGVLENVNSNDRHDKHHDDDEMKEPADIIASFGSRISFQGNNDVGLALCDKSSMARGDIKCDD